MVGLLGQQHKAGLLVNAARRVQDVVGPQTQCLVAPGFGKSDAFLGQTSPQPHAAHLRLDVQQTQLGLGVRDLDHKHRAHHPALALGDPGVFLFRVQVLDVLRSDLGHHSLERAIPSVFLRIQKALPVRHPTDVAHLKGAQNRVGRHAGCHVLSPLS